MKYPLSFLLLLFISIGFNACKSTPSGTDTSNVKEQASTANEANTGFDVTGNYVTDSYQKRAEGYDWMAVLVTKTDKDELSIKLRSRSDKKKPTCTLDMIGYKLSNNTYQATVQGEMVQIEFKKDELTISVADDALWVLAYPCSGGATAAGTYTKLEGQLDRSHLDPTVFSSSLPWGDTENYWVTTKVVDEKTQLSIDPVGPISAQEPFIANFDGEVTGAVINDLNNDGFAEVLVFTVSGENHIGNVYGVSSNSGKSISAFYYAPAGDDPALNNGYQGNDTFSVENNLLVNRFPIYNNGQQTGKLRQVTYALVNGKNGRLFAIKDVAEVDAK